MLRGGKGKNSERREHHWNFSNVLCEEYVLNKPLLGGSRNSCLVECLCPHLLAVVSAHLYQLIC